jgi:hypothetical protein
MKFVPGYQIKIKSHKDSIVFDLTVVFELTNKGHMPS